MTEIPGWLSTEIRIDTSAADINLNLMKKYIDPASGKLYLLPDENK